MVPDDLAHPPITRLLPRADCNGLAVLDDMTLHCLYQLVFVRARWTIQQGIQPIDPELVPDHLPRGRAGAGVPGDTTVRYPLDCQDRFVRSVIPWTARTGSFVVGSRGIPAGITGRGGRFQQIHGVKEQQDFSNGLNTMTATDLAERPVIQIRGERFSPSQVCVGGNSRKSSETTSFSMVLSLVPINKKVLLRCIVRDGHVPVTGRVSFHIFIVP